MRQSSVLIVLLFIILCNIGVWWFLNRPHSGVPWHGEIQSISFSPFRKDDDPLQGKFPPIESIRKDMALVSNSVGAIRLYSSDKFNQAIPAIAQDYGLKVMAGAWIKGIYGGFEEHPPKAQNDISLDDQKLVDQQIHFLAENEEEINNLIMMVQQNPNINRVVIGNESILSRTATVPQLISYIRKVKSKLSIPVTTAEPASVWLAHPELVREVDFIALHVFPYWQGISADDSIDFILGELTNLKTIYPDKHVMLGEVGWPSGGKGRQRAEPSLINQALFLRRFLNRAKLDNIDYNLFEAFDEPWKKSIEFSVGTHWGLWDVDRSLKFSMSTSIQEVKNWPLQAFAATCLAGIPIFWFLMNWNHLKTRGKIFFGILVQASASLVIWAMSEPVIRDFAPSAEIMYTVMIPALTVLLVIVLIGGYELTQLTWSREMLRKFTPETAPKSTYYPKVSLHLACYNEPPDMVKLTLDSLAALDYPNFEVIILDNNTKSPDVWQPLLHYCTQLGDRFKFYHLSQWPGAKAGALNFGLTQTSQDAVVIGIIDSDYQVSPDWLKTLVPYFENEKVGWVQAPQDHREWEYDLFKEAINWEYAGFFDIGMVARNEDNAIIQHGTMTLIRKDALIESGGWAEWTIVEDAELGLRLLELGYEAIYLSHRFGHGLTPDNFTAYKKQRYRWAYGACQIIKAHWRALIPFRNTGLTNSQKYHFLTGWLPWLSDAFYLLFTVLSILWSIGLILAPLTFDFPLAIFIMPTVGVFVAKLVHHLFLYGRRVKCNWRQKISAAIAGMGLTFSIGKAMWQGIFTQTIPFLRTPKCEDKAAWTAGFIMASEESLLMLLQWLCALAVLIAKGWHDLDARIWALVLIVQSMPYFAALITSLVSAMPTENLMRKLHKANVS
jgi:exo-beta-1,3-glucanase (GH17 family)/cellulose synthase/poly-beta-1,6-N-acetylglucosamine synthase-like glycosyltransferase